MSAKVPLRLVGDGRGCRSALRTPHSAFLVTTPSAAGTTTCASRSPTAATSAAPTACRRTSTFLDRTELLTFEEIARVRPRRGRAGHRQGPAHRRRAADAEGPAQAGAHARRDPGHQDVGLTTNGILLADQAAGALRRRPAAAQRLARHARPGRFRELTRRDGLEKVLAGLDAAKRAGFDPIKVNAVAIRGFTEHDVVPLARYCRDNGFELRFIEYMPIGAEAWERDKVFFAHEILELIDREVGATRPGELTTRPPRRSDFDYRDGGGRVGIIASVSRPFCHHCNRIRLTADGKLRNCLFALDETDVKGLLRAGTLDENELAEVIRRTRLGEVGGARDQHREVREARPHHARHRRVMPGYVETTMNPRDEFDDDRGPDDSADPEPVIRELRTEMIRQQAQIDQIAAAAHDRAEEIAILRAPLAELQSRSDASRTRYRRSLRMWVLVGVLYGLALGVALSFLLRP